jgi:hypothetical protein
MKTTNKKTLMLLIGLILASQLCGCTNWEKKYNALNVEHQNLKGLLERERAEKQQITDNRRTSKTNFRTQPQPRRSHRFWCRL